MEAWASDLDNPGQHEAELAEHRRIAEAHQQSTQQLLIRVAEMARTHIRNNGDTQQQGDGGAAGQPSKRSRGA